jgi:tetratricopeptide (TPR) repeat protein
MSLLEYAKFLDKCELLYQAEDYFLRVLELDSTFVTGLRYYGYFLEKLEQREEAEKFFIRAAETDFRRNHQRNARFIQQQKLDPSTSFKNPIVSSSSPVAVPSCP